MVLTFEPVEDIVKCGHLANETDIKQHFPVVLLIMQYKVIPTFESVDEILKYDHSHKCSWRMHSYGDLFFLQKLAIESVYRMQEHPGHET